MVSGWIILAIIMIIVGVILKEKTSVNDDSQDNGRLNNELQDNDYGNTTVLKNSNEQGGDNYFVAITASILFPFTGLPHLILLLCCNNEKTKTIIGILEVINMIILSIMLLILVCFLILFGTCFVQLLSAGHF